MMMERQSMSMFLLWQVQGKWWGRGKGKGVLSLNPPAQVCPLPGNGASQGPPLSLKVLSIPALCEMSPCLEVLPFGKLCVTESLMKSQTVLGKDMVGRAQCRLRRGKLAS